MMSPFNSSRKPGNTPLMPLDDLAHRFGVKKIYIKDESANPFGTIKDRRSYEIVNRSRIHVDKLALITSGNNGYSLGKFSENHGINVVCVVDRNMQADTKARLQETCYQIIESNLKHKILRPEEVVAFARERDDEVIWDVTNGFEEAYEPIIREIQKMRPTHLVVPVGSGGIFTGLGSAIEKMRLKMKLIGIGVQDRYESFADKLNTPWTPYAKAMTALEARGHRIHRLSEQAVQETYQAFRDICPCEPSSAVVFGVFRQHQFSPKDTVVLLNTGSSLKLRAV